MMRRRWAGRVGKNTAPQVQEGFAEHGSEYLASDYNIATWEICSDYPSTSHLHHFRPFIHTLVPMHTNNNVDKAQMAIRSKSGAGGNHHTNNENAYVLDYEFPTNSFL